MNKNLKISILAALSIFSSLIYGYLLKLVFVINLLWWQQAIIVLTAAILFLAFWGLFALLVQNHFLIFLLSLIDVSLLYLFLPFNYYYLSVGLITLLIMQFYSYPKVVKEIKSRIKFDIDAILTPSLKPIILAIALLVTINYYFSGTVKWQLSIPDHYTDKIMEMQIPGYSPQLTFDELVYLFIIDRTDFKDNGLNNVKSFINEQKVNIPLEQFQKYKESIVKQWKIADLNIKGDQEIGETKLSSKLINDNIKQIQDKYQNISKIILLVAFFEAISYLGRILFPLVILFIWLIYKLMMKIGFVSLHKSQVEAEEIKLE